MEFTNKGGDGRYLLLPAADWAAAAQQHQQDQLQQQQLAATAHLKPPTSSVARGPDSLNKTAATAVYAGAMQESPGSAVSSAFQISPTFLDLPASSTANFTVHFTPTEFGMHQGDFVLVCDNCTVQQLSVQGYGAEVDVQLVELDGRRLHEGEIEAPIWFGQVGLRGIWLDVQPAIVSPIRGCWLSVTCRVPCSTWLTMTPRRVREGVRLPTRIAI